MFHDEVLRYGDLIDKLKKNNSRHTKYLRSYLLPKGEKNELNLFTRPRYVYKKNGHEPIEGTFSTCFALFSLLRTHKNVDDIAKELYAEDIFQKYADILETDSSSWHYPPFPKPFDIYTVPFKLICLHMISQSVSGCKLKYTKNVIIALHEIIKNLHENEASKFSTVHDYSGFLSYWNFVALYLFYDQLPTLKQIIREFGGMRKNSVTIKIDMSGHTTINSDKQNPPTITIEKKYLPTRKNIEDLLKKLFVWSRNELYKQATFYHINDDDRIDPIRTIFCLSIYKTYNKLRKDKKIPLSDLDLKYNKKGVDVLLREIFSNGGESLWKKYLPILAIPSYDGNVYPFPMSSLNRLLSLVEPVGPFLDHYLNSIDDALDWVKRNERKNVPYVSEKKIIKKYFQGWRSSHSTNPNGYPECWSTALVFDTTQNMEKLCRKFRSNAILRELKGNINEEQNPEEFVNRWDSTILIQDREYSVKQIMREEFIMPRLGNSEEEWENFSNSCILYGPPGTGKSTLVESIGNALGWSYLRVDTALLLQNGLDKATDSVSKIFDLLTKLEKSVILFDEIDECIRDRGDGSTVLQNHLLTNTLLTKLNDLAKNRKIIFFVATNYGDKIDKAITRPGRFDLIVDLNFPHYEELYSYLKKQFRDSTISMPKGVKARLRNIYKTSKENDLLEELTYHKWKKFVHVCITMCTQQKFETEDIVNLFEEYFVSDIKITNYNKDIKPYFSASDEVKYVRSFNWKKAEKSFATEQEIFF